MWAAVVPRVRPKIAPRAYGSQCGAPRPTNAGTTTTPSELGTLRRQLFDIDRRLDDAQAIAQPLHDRAGDEHGPFQAIRRLAADLPADGRQQLVLAEPAASRRCSAA